MGKPLVDKEFFLERFQGKGGWTYAIIPEVPQNKENPFGWERVRGSIDGYEIKSCHLMPMGNGNLFLPVKAEIRKKIGKKEGDSVRIILYADDAPIEIPEEFLLCLLDNPTEHTTFLSYSDGEQRAFINWIYSAKTDATRIDRIAKSLDKVSKKQRFYPKMINNKDSRK